MINLNIIIFKLKNDVYKLLKVSNPTLLKKITIKC